MQRNCLHCTHATTAEKVLGYRTTAMLACSREKHTAQWIDRQCRNHKFQVASQEVIDKRKAFLEKGKNDK